MKTVLETLEAARKLLTPRGAWIQGTFAQAKDGTTCASTDSSACRWCAQGAINRTVPSNNPTRQDTYTALEYAMRCEITTFNDTHTKAKVLAAFDAAIAAEKAKAVHES